MVRLTSTTDDLVEGGGVTDTIDGFEARRVFNLVKLSGRSHQKLFRALQSPRVPQKGDFHPSIPGIVAVRRSATATGADGAEITIEYRGINIPDQIEVGTTIQEVEVEVDVFGNLIAVGITETQIVGTDDAKNEIVKKVELPEEPVSVIKQIPQTVIRLRRLEPRDPRTKSKAFVGTINRTSIFDDPPHFWLCTGIEGSSTDGGFTFDVTYEFQRNTDTWNKTIVFIDANTGKIHKDAKKFGNGFKTIRLYEETEFRDLRLNRLR